MTWDLTVNVVDLALCLSTLGAVVVALGLGLRQVRVFNVQEEDAQKRDAARARWQAERVAAWVVREAGSLWLYASNQSPYPVYQVNVQIGTTGAGTFALECLPPGPPHRLTEIEASHIRHFDAAEITFKDSAGRSWRRDQAGVLDPK